MDHFVELDRLPEGFAIPEDCRDRLRFEPQSRRLLHSGFMSKADYDRLCLLTDDWPFRRKLDELFRLCSSAPSPRPKGLRRLVSSISALWMA